MYKIKKGFILCPVNDDMMAVSTGALEKDFPGLIKMNATCASIWKMIEEGKELDEMYSEYAGKYEISVDKARVDIDSIVNKMLEAGIFEETPSKPVVA